MVTVGQVIEILKIIFNFIVENFGGLFSGLFGGDAEGEEETTEPAV